MSVDSLQSAAKCMHMPEAREFVDSYLHSMIVLILNQNPANLGTSEKLSICTSLHAAMNILLALPVEELCTKQLHTLARMLDDAQHFYAGVRQTWSSYTSDGCPEERKKLAAAFCEGGGLVRIANYSTSLDTERCLLWSGKDSMKYLNKMLKSVAEIDGLIDEKEVFVKEVLRGLGELTEAEMKSNETAELISDILDSLKTICYCDVDISKPQFKLAQMFHPFWQDLTGKLISSGSLVLKLLAWDQMNELIIEAHKSKPRARSYIVTGAGLDWVNGCYTFSHYDYFDQSVKYSFVPNNPDVALLTMSRCKMQNGSRWWYISYADLQSPGTDKDIDYYQKTVEKDKTGDVDLEMTGPPLTGWVVASNKSSKGVAPAPDLAPEGLIMNEGMTEADFLVHRLKNYILSANLIQEVFGPSMHQEVVSRCSKMLFFMAELECITAEHLKMIWLAAIKTDPECARGVLTTLVGLCTKLSKTLYSGVVDMIVASLNAPHTLEHLTRVAMFTDNFDSGIIPMLNDIEEGRVLELVWAMYTSTHFDSLKTSHQVIELLNVCCNMEASVDTVLQKLLGCSALIAGFATAKKVDESAVSRALQQVCFLVNINTASGNEIMVQTLESNDFGRTLVGEVYRFVRACDAKKAALGIDERTAQISLRLEALRMFYGLCSNINISEVHTADLWKLLSSSPHDLEAIFAFFEDGCRNVKDRFSVFGDADLSSVITTYVCSPVIDWSNCGDHAFSCLTLCFHRISPAESEYITLVDTLWRAALNIPDDKNTRIAAQYLLEAYDDLTVVDSVYDGRLLQVTLEHLCKVQEECKSSTAPVSPQRKVQASRCIDLLSMAITRSKSVSCPPHGVRGSTGRYDISVKYRKATTWNTANGESRTIDRTSINTTTLHVHPMHTLLQLKERVRLIARFAAAARISVEVNDQLIDLSMDQEQLQSLGIEDGSAVTVTGAISSYDAYNTRNRAIDTDKNDEQKDFKTRVGEAIAGDDDKFLCLMTLCDDLSGKCSDLSEKIWGLLMLVPTQINLETVLLSDSNLNWDEFLGISSARTTYILQMIDSTLQPAEELISDESLNRAEAFRKRFMSSGGFACLLNIIATTNMVGGGVHKAAMGVALQILRRLLAKPIGETGLDESAGSPALERAELYKTMHSKSGVLVTQLVAAASQAAALSESQTVENALATITDLLSSSDVASQLTSDPQSKVLLATSLQSASQKVREMSCKFAIQLGRSQPVAFSWLIDELELINGEDAKHSNMFHAVKGLLVSFRPNPQSVDVVKLAKLLHTKIVSYSLAPSVATGAAEKWVLLGYLDLYAALLDVYPAPLMDGTLSKQVVSLLLTEYLFSVPSGTDDKTALCDTPRSRKAAFAVLRAIIGMSRDALDAFTSEIGRLLEGNSMKGSQKWNRQLSMDLKKAGIPFCGLKNQGCTCYMNSLLQQLFMCTPFREAVLNCELKESHRGTMWHRSDEDLVGADLVLESSRTSGMQVRVLGWDPVQKKHQLQVLNKPMKPFYVALRGGNSIVRIAKDEEDLKLSPEDENAYRVLDQLQRTFCHLLNSKRRYFDPKPLVDACATLNLNYNVYQQNDVTEFFDQLSDRIETATKTGKIAGLHRDVWKDVVMKEVLNGSTLYQKVPRSCEFFENDRNTCGHWQSARVEAAPKIQLNVRNMGDIHEALENFFASELMDGDNKINCEVCCEKKATLRRTVMGQIPNTMVLHLKRFDLDYDTFETVKLNNRMEFPLEINVLRYTKEGIEAAERADDGNDDGDEEGSQYSAPASPSPRVSAPNSPVPHKKVLLEYEKGIEEPNAEDYTYELQGVVVHAGIAGGGHYYSFARDSEQPDKWYKFDDDDVTEFHYSPETIAYECFGGSLMNSDLDRTSNALMLFYSKKKQQPQPVSPKDALVSLPGSFPDIDNPSSPTRPVNDTPTSLANPQNRLIDGRKAYAREVHESNLQHIVSQYLLDSGLHDFVRSLLQAGPATADSAQRVLATLKFSLGFLFSTVLHCKDKLNLGEWVGAVQSCFSQYPQTVHWFLQETLLKKECSWLEDYLYLCPDGRAGNTFVSILISAVRCMVPQGDEGLRTFEGMNLVALREYCTADLAGGAMDAKAGAALCTLLALEMKESLYVQVWNNMYTSQAVFVVLRELAVEPSLRRFLVVNECVSALAHFALLDSWSAPAVKAKFPLPRNVEGQAPQQPMTLHDTKPLLPLAFEAIAALLGSPQPPKMQLLADRKGLWEYALTPLAKEAVRVIFFESSRNDVMSEQDLRNYMERIYGRQNKQASQQACIALYARLTRDGGGLMRFKHFCAWLTDIALTDENSLWVHLNAFNFRNDLSRALDSDNMGVIPPATQLQAALQLPPNCSHAISVPFFYQIGDYYSISPAYLAILGQAAMFNQPRCIMLIEHTLTDLRNRFAREERVFGTQFIQSMLRVLLTAPDGHAVVRLRDALLNANYGIITVIEKELLTSSRGISNMCHYYQELLSDVVENTRVRALADDLAISEPRVQVQLDLLQPAVAVASEIDNDYSFDSTKPGVAQLEYTYVVVEGAGSPEVDGQYNFREIFKGAAWYERDALPQSHGYQYSIYKCPVEPNTQNWFLSKTLIDKKPGTDADIDYYSAAPFDEAVGYPEPGLLWETCGDANCGVEPCPTISVHVLNEDGLDTSLDSVTQKWVGTHLPISPDLTPLDSPAFTPDASPSRVNRRRTVSTDSDAPGSTSSVAGDASDNDNLYDNGSLDGADDITFEVNGLGLDTGSGLDSDLRNGSAPAWQE